MECIFCKIIKGEIPSHKVYEDDYIIAFLDIAPVNPGHVLVVTKKHVPDLDDLDDLLAGYVMSVVKKVGEAQEEGIDADAYNVILNNGSEAGQMIDHFHMHVIPRHKDDGIENWPQGEYEDDEAEKYAKKIKGEIDED